MLDLLQITHRPARRADAPPALDLVTVTFPTGQVTAVTGTAGAGKRALLEVLAGLARHHQGVRLLDGRDLEKHPLAANEFAFVSPVRHQMLDQLRVTEALASSLLLRTGDLSRRQVSERVAAVIARCGLETVSGSSLRALTPLQARKLQLATALVADPALVVCEDFTRGMDAKAGRELIALLLDVARERNDRVVINVTDSLVHLPGYDSVVVLHEGRACFHGPARAIPHYFTVKSVEDLYPRLAMRPASRWSESWSRHRESYYKAFKISSADDGAVGETEERISLPKADAESEVSGDPVETDGTAAGENGAPEAAGAKESGPRTVPRPAGMLAQARLLAKRRWTRLTRTRREWRLQALLSLGLPFLVVLLIWPNKPALQSLAGDEPGGKPWVAAFTAMMACFAQVMLVIFMAARNGSREIARERRLFAAERLAGVSMMAFFTSKLLFLLPLVLWQSLWMGLCVEMFVPGIPGNAAMRMALLMMTGISFTSLCMAISAWQRDPERAHNLALTFALAQVVFAGAVLGLPRVLGGILQPLVPAYYGWSAMIEGMKHSAVYPLIDSLVRTWFAPPALALGALAVQALAGLLIALAGLRRRELP
jgi:ABC-type multidrug transport system ATPase subunit